MARTTSAVDTETVLDELVNQFSDPMSFLRELIQNSIDAGSGEIDVRVEFEPKPGEAQGLMTCYLDDFGEGMSREIIESKLTRLFSSGKDDDFTKIGRFGIGFVSVFAIQPQVVCVDTGRGGKYWRVLFREDRTFDLIALDAPVEGTQIRIFKQADRAEFEHFERRAREVILYWCKHVLVPIYFQGEQLNRDFAIESRCQVSHQEEGTRAVVGFVDGVQAPFGYYNRGLTLKEGEESDWAHVTLKIDSRYLEHTLTRDQVLKDRHFHKAQRLLTAMIEERLPEQLMKQLEDAAKRCPEARAEFDALCRLAINWARTWGDPMADGRDRRPIIPTLYGEPVTLRALQRRRQKGEAFVTRERTHVSDAMQAELALIPSAPSRQSPLFELLEIALQSTLPALEDSWCLPAPSSLDLAPGANALRDLTREFVRGLGGRVEFIKFMKFDYTERSRLSGRLAVLLESLDAPCRLETLPPLTREKILASRCLALAADNEQIQRLVELARHEPEWAAFTLVKVLLLHEGLAPADDSALVSMAIERRMRRLGQGGLS